MMALTLDIWSCVGLSIYVIIGCLVGRFEWYVKSKLELTDGLSISQRICKIADVVASATLWPIAVIILALFFIKN